MDMITQIMNTFDGHFVDERGWIHYRAKGKDYDITFHPRTLEWECNCLAFRYRRRHKSSKCKHITEVQNHKHKNISQS